MRRHPTYSEALTIGIPTDPHQRKHRIDGMVRERAEPMFSSVARYVGDVSHHCDYRLARNLIFNCETLAQLNPGP